MPATSDARFGPRPCSTIGKNTTPRNRQTPPPLKNYKKVIIITKKLKLKEPSDVRNLIKRWLAEVAETGELPFKGNTGGVVVQMLNTWLKSYELEKLEDVEKRLIVLEEAKDQYLRRP